MSWSSPQILGWTMWNRFWKENTVTYQQFYRLSLWFRHSKRFHRLPDQAGHLSPAAVLSAHTPQRKTTLWGGPCPPPPTALPIFAGPSGLALVFSHPSLSPFPSLQLSTSSFSGSQAFVVHGCVRHPPYRALSLQPWWSLIIKQLSWPLVPVPSLPGTRMTCVLPFWPSWSPGGGAPPSPAFPRGCFQPNWGFLPK